MKDIEKASLNALRSTINKLLNKGQTAANKKVREVYNVKAKDLRDRTIIKRATNSRVEGFLIVRGRRMPVVVFGARQTKRGVSVLIKRTGGRKLIKSSFLAQMKSGHLGVYQRLGNKRLPIKELFTIDIAKMYEVEGSTILQGMVEREGSKLLKNEMKFYLEKSQGTGKQ